MTLKEIVKKWIEINHDFIRLGRMKDVNPEYLRGYEDAVKDLERKVKKEII